MTLNPKDRAREKIRREKEDKEKIKEQAVLNEKNNSEEEGEYWEHEFVRKDHQKTKPK